MVSAVHRSELVYSGHPASRWIALLGKYGCAPGATSSIKKRADRSRLSKRRTLVRWVVGEADSFCRIVSSVLVRRCHNL